MKKSIFLLMTAMVAALSSCNKSDDTPTLQREGEMVATFNVESILTRATVNGLTRYIVEAYEGKNLSTTPLRVENANGSLTLTLKKNTEYTFLFWADNGVAKTENIQSSGYWNTDDLRAVTVAENKKSNNGEAAYCLALSFNSKDFEANKTVSLKNATAQVNFVETEGLATTDNTLTVKYASITTLNVATGKVTDATEEITHTFTGIAAAAKDATLATDYLLAPLGEQNLVNMKITLNDESEKSIANVPFQQSYKTNIKGEYSNFYVSTFTVSNEVEDYTDNDIEIPEILEVGSFYYDNDTWSSDYDTHGDTRTCIGIVFLVNADGKSGKIVGLPVSAHRWGIGGASSSLDESTKVEGIRSTTDGSVATKNMILAHKDEPDFATNYAAFNWIYTTINNNDINGRWYIPAKDELLALYAAWNGDATSTANEEARTAFNDKLNTAGGVLMPGTQVKTYLTATENGGASVHVVDLSKGTSSPFYKDVFNNVRVISAF